VALGLVVVIAAVIGTLVYRSASSSASSSSDVLPPGTHRAKPPAAPSGGPSLSDVPRGGHGEAAIEGDDAVSEDDGALPDGVTVFDDEYRGITDLDPDLLRAMRAAASAAADDGIEFAVNSGWRSAAYQDQLFRAAVATYGSEKEAARWVATAKTSAHVSGDAVDIGPFDATAWLLEHGADYGLCQTYRNESWHYELRPKAVDRGCPPAYADPAHDPSLQH
jgi:hypothetical protein